MSLPPDVNLPPSTRCMGDGHEPHVDEVAGRLVYSLPADSGFVGTSFSFEIGEADLRVLLADPHRRAILEVVAHTVLQRSMIRGNPEVAQADFRRLVDWTLHASPEKLATLVAEIDREHNMSVAHFVRATMTRRASAPADGESPCVS